VDPLVRVIHQDFPALVGLLVRLEVYGVPQIVNLIKHREVYRQTKPAAMHKNAYRRGRTSKLILHAAAALIHVKLPHAAATAFG
jgi:hypothetical protein